MQLTICTTRWHLLFDMQDSDHVLQQLPAAQNSTTENEQRTISIDMPVMDVRPAAWARCRSDCAADSESPGVRYSCATLLAANSFSSEAPCRCNTSVSGRCHGSGTAQLLASSHSLSSNRHEAGLCSLYSASQTPVYYIFTIKSITLTCFYVKRGSYRG